MMSEASVNLLHELLQSPAFVAAFKEFVDMETQIRTARLRNFLRLGDTNNALVTEGEISAIEDLPGLFIQYAKAHRAH